MSGEDQMLEAMDRAARFFDCEFAGYEEDLPALEAFAFRTGSPLLELGCGTGRALVPLAEAGFHATGIDVSPAMLAVAAARAAQAGVQERVTLVQGDFGVLRPPGGPYQMALALMNTFLHLATVEAQLAALSLWREALAPGGLLLVDVLHPDPHEFAGFDGRLEWDRTWIDPDTGATVMKFLIRTVDMAEQVIDVSHVYDEVAPDGATRRTLAAYRLRYLWRFEAQHLLERAGFALEALYGDWSLAPFRHDSPRMIFVARRAGRSAKRR